MMAGRTTASVCRRINAPRGAKSTRTVGSKWCLERARDKYPGGAAKLRPKVLRVRGLLEAKGVSREQETRTPGDAAKLRPEVPRVRGLFKVVSE